MGWVLKDTRKPFSSARRGHGGAAAWEPRAVPVRTGSGSGQPHSPASRKELVGKASLMQTAGEPKAPAGGTSQVPGGVSSGSQGPVPCQPAPQPPGGLPL